MLGKTDGVGGEIDASFVRPHKQVRSDTSKTVFSEEHCRRLEKPRQASDQQTPAMPRRTERGLPSEPAKNRSPPPDIWSLLLERRLIPIIQHKDDLLFLADPQILHP